MAYDFGLRLRSCRKKVGLSQDEVGDRLGISGSAIGAYENNIGMPSVKRLVQLCKLYNVSTDFLLNINTPEVEAQEDLMLEMKDLIKELEETIEKATNTIRKIKDAVNE